MKLPRWLPIALTPIVFLGSCTASLGPIWEWQDAKMTHAVTEADRGNVPLLARKDGKYVEHRQFEGSTVVTVVNRADEALINRELSDSIGYKGEYRWFQVLEEKDGVMHVSLEAPYAKEGKRKGWYALHDGEITMERIVYYGPGFAFYVLPWTLGVGALCTLIYFIAVHTWEWRRDAAAQRAEADAARVDARGPPELPG